MAAPQGREGFLRTAGPIANKKGNNKRRTVVGLWEGERLEGRESLQDLLTESWRSQTKTDFLEVNKKKGKEVWGTKGPEEKFGREV